MNAFNGPRIIAEAMLGVVWIVCSNRSVMADDSQVKFTAGITFAEVAEETLKLNLAQPVASTGPATNRKEEVEKKFPAVVCIHGGGFSGGRREEYDESCRKLAKRGYVAVTIDEPQIKTCCSLNRFGFTNDWCPPKLKPNSFQSKVADMA